MTDLLHPVPAWTTTTLNLAFFGYFVCAAFYALLTLAGRRTTPRFLKGLLLAVWLQHGAGLLGRWVATGRPPFISLYEMVIFLAWATPAVWLIVESAAPYLVIGTLTCLFASLALAYSDLLDPSVTPLVPALQSNWLTTHILTYLLGYAACFVAFLLAVCYLARQSFKHRFGMSLVLGWLVSSVLLGYDLHSGRIPEAALGVWGVLGLSVLGALLAATPLVLVFTLVLRLAPHTLPDSPAMLNRVVGLAFPLLTLGLVTGAVWAEQAWNTYWSWDNKENWSLITWGVYAAYLHAIYVMQWRQTRAVYLVLVGFLCLIITWLGVNYVGFLHDPLHSYASPAATVEHARWQWGVFPTFCLCCGLLSALVLRASRRR